jgi:hypothetical protein
VEARSGGIKTAVEREGARIESRFEIGLIGGDMNQTTPDKLIMNRPERRIVALLAHLLTARHVINLAVT